MRSIPVDTERARVISTGAAPAPVQEYGELSDGQRRRTGNQAKTADGVPLWHVECLIPGEDGGRTEVVRVKVASYGEPEAGAFGDVLALESPVVTPYVDRASGRVALSWSAAGVKGAGSRRTPAPSSASSSS